MSMEDCANFLVSCTNDPCAPTDSRIINLFKKYDENYDGFLNL